MDDQAHAARIIWNCLHAWWQMMPKEKRTLANADAAIRQARKDVDFLAVLPAQAAQAVLKTCFQAWKNCWDGRADAPDFKGRLRSVMSVDIPQGRDLQIKRVHRRWGVADIPKVGRVRFRWTKDLPVGKHADADSRITGARLVKDHLGWHVAFRVMTLDTAPTPHQGPEIGIDAGVNLPLALSDGNHFDHGRPTRLPDGKADRDKWLNADEKAKLLRLERRAAQRRTHRKSGELTSRRLHRTYDQIRGLRATPRDATRTGSTRRPPPSPSSTARSWSKHSPSRKSARGTFEEPGRNISRKSGLIRSISQEAWSRTVTMLTYKTNRYGGTLHMVPAPNTSLRCSACGFITPGSREDQATFVCKNPDCGWSGNADWNASRNVLHLYRIGLALIPAAGRAVVRRARRVKPPTAR